MLDFDLNEYCYGCGACVNCCPHDAIQLIQDKDGCYVPQIDESACIHCGKCERVCIHLHSVGRKASLAEQGCYVAFQNDIEQRERSASGGMFFPLACEIIRQGGYVCGCVWNEEMTAVHIVTNQIEDVERMCNSKYVQSNTGRCFEEIRELLREGKRVLFSGTPCQCAACKATVGDPDNLIALAIICEGTPSPKVWQKYREAKEKAYGSKITEVNFRCKEPIGWSLPYYTVKTDVGISYHEISYHENSFVLGLLQGLTYRNSCYHCAYKGNNGCADIVVGDLWKVDHILLKKSGNKGISALLLNTEKGRVAFEQVAEQYYLEDYPLETVQRNNPPLMKSGEKNTNRERFFQEIDSMPIEENLDRNVVRNKRKLALNKVLIRTGLYKPFRDLNHILRDYRHRGK